MHFEAYTRLQWENPKNLYSQVTANTALTCIKVIQLNVHKSPDINNFSPTGLLKLKSKVTQFECCARVSATDPFLWLGSVGGEQLHIIDNNFFFNHPKIPKLRIQLGFFIN